MGFFNDAVVDSLFGGVHICSQCGSEMEFENEWEDVLVCAKCGHSVDTERYGFENDEDYDALYPTEEEVLGRINDTDDSDETDADEDDDTGEEYDEVCGELDDYVPPLN